MNPSPALLADTRRPQFVGTRRDRLRLDGWEFSHHALTRLTEMGATPKDAITVLTHPARTDYPCSSTGPHSGYRTAWWGTYGVAYNPENGHILTVLFNTREAYIRP